MSHTIFQIGTVAIMIKNPNGRILGFTLPEDGKVPEEFGSRHCPWRSPQS